MPDRSFKLPACPGVVSRHKLIADCRVLIADDHKLVAQALQRLLEDHFDDVAAVNDGYELLKAVAASKPDVVLVEIGLPMLNGIEAARRIRTVSPKTKIIALTMYSDPEYVVEAIRAGASGYVLKTCTFPELMSAIQEVLSGHLYLSPSINSHELSVALSSHNCRSLLTTRQREVLQLVAEGLTAKEIARALNLSVKTAVFHKMGLMEKLGLRSTAALTRYALEHGFIGRTSEGASDSIGTNKVQSDQRSRAAFGGSAG